MSARGLTIMCQSGAGHVYRGTVTIMCQSGAGHVYLGTVTIMCQSGAGHVYLGTVTGKLLINANQPLALLVQIRIPYKFMFIKFVCDLNASDWWFSHGNLVSSSG
jgi:hypothetical protein